MKVAVTGGTGFIGRYILRNLVEQGHAVRSWKRSHSDLTGLADLPIEWVTGDLTNLESMQSLVQGCDAVVHAALWKPGVQFRGGEGPVPRFAEVNLVGSLQLIQSAMDAGTDRFVFLSTCAVYEIILEDRALDEAHPCWASSHYGAHKAAIEKFVHSYAMGEAYNICALRPPGVYGLHHQANESKWFDLVQQIKSGQAVHADGGNKLVHASDVATATSLLLESDHVAGQAFNCYDRFISNHQVACLAKELSQSNSVITGSPKQPKHEIETGKLRDKGMTFGGLALLKQTVQQLLAQ